MTDIEKHIAALKDTDWEVRENASFELGQIGDASAVPALIEAVNDTDWSVRCSVVNALGKIGDASAIPALLGVLKDTDEPVRRTAAEALVQIGGGDTAAVSFWLDALHDSDEVVRKNAIFALGQIGDASAVPALITILKSKPKIESEIAVKALVKIGEPAVPALLKIYSDPDQSIHKSTTLALTQTGVGGTSAVPYWLEALHDSNMEGCISVLVQIGDASAVGILIEALKDTEWKVRYYAVSALGDTKDASAVPALIEALKNTYDYMICPSSKDNEAQQRLDFINNEVQQRLDFINNDINALIRKSIVSALGQIGDASAVPALIEIIQDKHKPERDSAVEALVKIGKPAVWPLIGTFNASRNVCLSAMDALVKIGEPAVPALLLALKVNNYYSGIAGSVLKQIGRLEPTAILSSERLSPGEKYAILYVFDIIRYKGNGLNLNYEIGDVEKFCQRILHDEAHDVKVREGAEEVLQYRALVRPSSEANASST